MAGLVLCCAKDSGVKFSIGLSTRITIGALLLLVAGGLLWIDSDNKRAQELSMTERSAVVEAALRVEQVRLSQAIDTLRQDVVFLASTPPISGLVRASSND